MIRWGWQAEKLPKNLRAGCEFWIGLGIGYGIGNPPKTFEDDNPINYALRGAIVLK